MGATVGSVIDIFAYTSLMIPILNGVSAIVGKYNLDLNTLPQNFLGLSIGVGTIIAKHGIVEILNKIKSKHFINKKQVLDEIDTPTIQKFSTFDDYGETPDVDLIKEQ